MLCPRCGSTTTRRYGEYYCTACYGSIYKCYCFGCGKSMHKIRIAGYSADWHDHKCDERVVNQLEGIRRKRDEQRKPGPTFTDRLDFCDHISDMES